MIDTGVTLNHAILVNPLRVDYRRDCVNSSDANCAVALGGYNPDDCGNHGTGMASIISGNNNLGDNRRGFTGITVDSFKMYSGPSCQPSRNASVRAVQAAITAGDSVILLEDQDPEDEYGMIATAADNAYDHGVVVIAANGNTGWDPRTVRSPANAQKVLGIGALVPETMAVRDTSSRGPTGDWRTKPDLMAVDYVDRASTAGYTVFDYSAGTSTASAVATGGIALLANWMRSIAPPVDPGQVYALALAMSNGDGSSAYDQDRGAGLFRVPVGTAHWGAVSLTNKQTVTIQRTISPGTSARVAIWWPEGTTVHNDIDVTLRAPNGTEMSSASVYSVFEKVRFTTALQSGTWTITISGYSVVTANQVVYWALMSE